MGTPDGGSPEHQNEALGVRAGAMAAQAGCERPTTSYAHEAADRETSWAAAVGLLHAAPPQQAVAVQQTCGVQRQQQLDRGHHNTSPTANNALVSTPSPLLDSLQDGRGLPRGPQRRTTTMTAPGAGHPVWDLPHARHAWRRWDQVFAIVAVINTAGATARGLRWGPAVWLLNAVLCAAAVCQLLWMWRWPAGYTWRRRLRFTAATRLLRVLVMVAATSDRRLHATARGMMSQPWFGCSSMRGALRACVIFTMVRRGVG